MRVLIACKLMYRPGKALALILALVAFGLEVQASESRGDERSSFFCNYGLAHDYVKPLERLPSLRALPESGELPFGPRHFFLRSMGQRPLVFESEDVGFMLSHGRVVGGIPRPRLDWLVTARLTRVDGRGKVAEVLGERAKPVIGLGLSRGRSFAFKFQFEPGLYRLEIVFEDGAGRRLGRFGQYFRALRHTPPDAGLKLSGSSFLPGQTVAPWLENYGTGTFTFGLGARIEAFDGTGWFHSPIDPPRPAPSILLSVGSGEAASCWSFQIPMDAPPGRYRVALDARHFYERFEPSTPILLSSEFEILSGGGLSL